MAVFGTQRVIACSGIALRACFAVLLIAAMMPAALAEQRTFRSPDAAAQALVDALTKSDEKALETLFGSDFRTAIPRPQGAAAEARNRFLEAWAHSHKLVTADNKTRIAVGADGWTFPIPIVKTPAGWRFDTRSGAQEILVRRIGRNELSAIQTSLAYFDAQKEYASQDRRGDGVLEYAQRMRSTPGKHDGLYWDSEDGKEVSPLGPLFVRARAEGAQQGAGYNGYHYRILTAQGPDAPGGALSYVVRGRMIGGFALVAWPVKYGDTGVMTFIVNHDGVVYQKDLGVSTSALASRMTRFNPDRSWQKVEKPS